MLYTVAFADLLNVVTQSAVCSANWPSRQFRASVWCVQHPLTISAAPFLSLICIVLTDHVFNWVTQCDLYSREEQDRFGILHGSSYPFISHSFFTFIDPDLITLLAPFIRHAIFPIQEILLHVCQAETKNVILITFFKILPSQRMQYTTKRDGGTSLLLMHVTSLWC